ncbi:MAG: hypothetical protein ACYSWW_25700 [Planctomycetota bacterium]|jgi:hypothetical protein
MMKITTITISILLILVSLSCADKEPQAQNAPTEHPLPGQQSAPEHPRPAVAPASHSAPHQMKPTLEKQEISVEPAEGGITIGDLFANKDTHADKTVLIRGKVTKVNRAILEKNWVHLQDGTSGSGKFDLTVTTLEQVNVGDIVTFKGKIVLNKDFGAGYKYDVLMEDAKLKPE